MDRNGKLVYAKSEEKNGGLGDKKYLSKGPEGRKYVVKFG